MTVDFTKMHAHGDDFVVVDMRGKADQNDRRRRDLSGPWDVARGRDVFRNAFARMRTNRHRPESVI